MWLQVEKRECRSGDFFCYHIGMSPSSPIPPAHTAAQTARKNSCPDCGNAPVNHAFMKGAIYFEMFLYPFMYVLSRLTRLIEPIFRSVVRKSAWPGIYRFLHSVGLGKIATEPDTRTTSRARVFWQEAKRRGINMWEFQLFGMGREFFVAEYEGKILSFEGLPRLSKDGKDREDPKSIDWIDNKFIMRKKFAAAGIPVAQGGLAYRFSAARKILEKIQTGSAKGNVIIKPHQGSRSRHTTTHIRDVAALKIAFRKAKVLSPFVVVEQELDGMVHRITLISGKVIGILRREPPCVFGDGIHSISELIEIENKNPLRAELPAGSHTKAIFHTLVTDEETHIELKRQNYKLESIPAKDATVFLNQKASRGIGGGTTDLTDIAHPDNIALFEYIAKYLDDSIVGIDFIISDMGRSYKNTPKCGVIECNSLPFIDLHLYPLVGTRRDTAGALWDLVLPESFISTKPKSESFVSENGDKMAPSSMSPIIERK